MALYAGLCVATRLADFEDGAEAGLRGTQPCEGLRPSCAYLCCMGVA